MKDLEHTIVSCPSCRSWSPAKMWNRMAQIRHSMLLLAALSATAVAAQTSAPLKPPAESAVNRFLRYVKIDTQSLEDQSTVPSTAKQFDLARMLEGELKNLGALKVRVSEQGIVYARIPGNLVDNSKVPVIGLIAHLDTAPELSGAHVNPIVHRHYQGGDIVLPKDSSQVIRAADNPDLGNAPGDDIITADGTTLLGSDDKAGIAEIMNLLDLLQQNPEIPHGDIAIGFVPDEEVGGAIKHFDIAGFGASYAYTVDGGRLGQIANETFSARSATITFTGKPSHPGSAKGAMINSAYALAEFLGRLPVGLRPESTELREGFIHPYEGTFGVETSFIKILLRDFESSGLDAQENLLKDLAAQTEAKFPGVKIALKVKPSYQNMKTAVDKDPEIIAHAIEATRRAGLSPLLKATRGGTDGSNLSARGLPTPNLFTGGHNAHSKLEWNSRRGLEKTTETLMHLVQIWAQR